MAERRRKALHLIDTGGPGGAETIFLQLVTRLPEYGWDSVAVVPVEDWLAEALRRDGVDPLKLSTHRSFDVAYAAAIRRMAKAEGADLVQTHLLASSVYAAIACLGSRLRVVSTFHGMADVRPNQGMSRAKLRVLRWSANRLVFVSEPLRAYFRSPEVGLDRGGIEVIPNGIDCALFAPGRSDALRRELDLPEGARLVGAVGNIRPPKGYDDLLRAFALVRQACPEAHLAIAGHPLPGLYDDLLRLRGSLGLDGSVTFLGFRENAPAILKALDVFVLSSTDEGFSLSTVQAMATGLPVVVTRSGGPETIVDHERSGLLVPPRDPAALAGGILDLLRSPERAERMGRAARERVLRDFSLERMVQRYAELYGRVLRGD